MHYARILPQNEFYNIIAIWLLQTRSWGSVFFCPGHPWCVDECMGTETIGNLNKNKYQKNLYKLGANWQYLSFVNL